MVSHLVHIKNIKMHLHQPNCCKNVFSSLAKNWKGSSSLLIASIILLTPNIIWSSRTGIGDKISLTTLPALPLILLSNDLCWSSSSSSPVIPWDIAANPWVTAKPIKLNVAVSTPRPAKERYALFLSSFVFL